MINHFVNFIKFIYNQKTVSDETEPAAALNGDLSAYDQHPLSLESKPGENPPVRLRSRARLAVLAAWKPAPTPATWTNTGSGNWSDPGTGAPNHAPASGDDVVITNSGAYAVTLDTSLTVNSLRLGGAGGTQTLDNPGYTLTLTGDSVVGTNGSSTWKWRGRWMVAAGC